MTNPKWLKVATQHSGQHSWTLGYVFAQYQKYEGKSAEELAAELGCSLDVLELLCLCRRPSNEDLFAEHLDLIEKRFAVKPRRLAAVLRRVEVLDVLPEFEEDGERIVEESILLAARDHSTDDETNS